MQIYKKHLLRIIYCENELEAGSLDNAVIQLSSNRLQILQCVDRVPLALAGQLHQEWEMLLAGEREVDMEVHTIGLLGSTSDGRTPYRIDPKIPHGDPRSGLQPIKRSPSYEADQKAWMETAERKLSMCASGGGSENFSTNVLVLRTANG